jgi:hypothetical protein
MKRFLVERRFPQGLSMPTTDEGRRACGSVVAVNAQQQVTWLHSYVSTDRKTVFCVYEGPSGDSIRAAADRNGLSIERLIEVSVLDPYFHLWS